MTRKPVTERDVETPAPEGEGSYTAGRNYDEAVQHHAAEADVDAEAEAAREAVDGPEGDDLRRAEKVGKRGEPSHAAR